MNPKTKETATRLNLIRLLSSSQNGLSLDELKRASGITSESELKKALGKLYMVGTYPYTPLDYLEIEYDGSRVKLLIPQNIDKTIVLTAREWIVLRDSLESELLEKASNRSLGHTQILENLLNKIRNIVPFNTIESFASMKKTIRNSIANNKTLEFSYRTREEINKSSDQFLSETRKVDPWFLLESNIDYLIGYCHSRQKSRIFRLESISDLTITDSKFNPPSNQITQAAMDRFQKFLNSPSKENRVASIWHTRETYYHLNQLFNLNVTSNKKTLNGLELIQSQCNIRDSRWFIESIIPFLPDVIIQDPVDLKEELVTYIKNAKSSKLLQNSPNSN